MINPQTINVIQSASVKERIHVVRTLSSTKLGDPNKKSRLGQFFTPETISRFMAEMFDAGRHDQCRLLDAGAGTGSLSAAFLERWTSGGFKFRHLELDAFEIDDSLHRGLSRTLDQYRLHPDFQWRVRGTDFIHAAANWISGDLFAEPPPTYTHAILNPPYKKIRTDSDHRAALRRAGIETVNLYTAFVALALQLLGGNGQLVAIIPRSFCNGPYYRPFRKFLLHRAAIQRIHLFGSRNKAFKDDDVLQENIIIRIERGAPQGPIVVSTSTDDGFSDLTLRDHPFDRIVFADDPEQFIRIPTTTGTNAIERCPSIRHSLSDLQIGVSTGPVVDFRVKEHLRDMPGTGSVPLLYPGHFQSGGVEWPKNDIKKPNAIQRNAKTEKWLYPRGYYCVVRRFSSKEEKRRVVANVVDPSHLDDALAIGFENHLNVFHDGKSGLPRTLAFGIAVYLNTTMLDEYFRTFNGHTQVNATDLRRIKYPSRGALMALGEWASEQTTLDQKMIDEQVKAIVA